MDLNLTKRWLEARADPDPRKLAMRQLAADYAKHEAERQENLAEMMTAGVMNRPEIRSERHLEDLARLMTALVDDAVSTRKLEIATLIVAFLTLVAAVLVPLLLA